MNIDFPHEITYNKLEIKLKIASGLTADIFEAKGDDGNKYAIKIFNRKSEKYYLSEINFLKQKITHKNIITAYEWGKVSPTDLRFGNRYYIIMEYIAFGDLATLISENYQKINENVIRHIIMEIANGLKEMHSKGFVHRDIKPENILISSFSPYPSIKLIDFGFADPINEISTEKKGTYGYMSPEVINKQPQNAESIDVFSLGVIAYILFTQEFPFETATSTDELFSLIIDKKWEDYWNKTKKNTLSSEAKEMLQGMLDYEASKRYTMEQLFHCKYISNSKPL